MLLHAKSKHSKFIIFQLQSIKSIGEPLSSLLGIQKAPHFRELMCEICPHEIQLCHFCFLSFLKGKISLDGQDSKPWDHVLMTLECSHRNRTYQTWRKDSSLSLKAIRCVKSLLTSNEEPLNAINSLPCTWKGDAGRKSCVRHSG